MSIFICEDSPEMAKLICLKLKSVGYQVQAFSDGEELIRRLKFEIPDLLILDVMMPGLDGKTILKFIKADPALKHLKVVMLTALSKEKDIVECLDAGAEDYITKPFSPAELASRVKKYMVRADD